ncbi:MAG TPA: hypothetical protein VH087_12520 [Thermoanaerobaculia bacterium]|jgi:hypothetical protein|nr:hypothetical protein [Thermoanaerobaculia bacterium]
MMIGLLLALALAPTQITRVSDDAKAIDRVVEISRGHDVPTDVLRRLVNEDIDLLRGRHADDTYDYASYERLEASRINGSFAVEPTGEDKLTRVETKGDFVYRVVLDMPNRRMIVTRNRPVFVDRLEVESIPMASSTKKTKTYDVKAWLQPGGSKTIDLDEISRHATVRLFARTDAKNGYGDIDLVLVQARVFDNPDSPYADAVSSAKAIQKALDHNDAASMRAMAQRIVADLQPMQGVAAIVPQGAAPETAQPDVQAELQAIEDLLTGSEAERRQGVDRLHQLIRRLRGR